MRMKKEKKQGVIFEKMVGNYGEIGTFLLWIVVE